MNVPEGFRMATGSENSSMQIAKTIDSLNPLQTTAAVSYVPWGGSMLRYGGGMAATDRIITNGGYMIMEWQADASNVWPTGALPGTVW